MLTEREDNILKEFVKAGGEERVKEERKDNILKDVKAGCEERMKEERKRQRIKRRRKSMV